jgi:predicted permease
MLTEIDEELRFHLEGRIAALVAQGVGAEEARARVLAAFGDMDRIRREMGQIEVERARRVRRRDSVSSFLMDLRLGARRLMRSPAHSAMAVATLALGIGACVSMFAVIEAVILRPLPYTEPERLVMIWPGRNMNIGLSRAVAGTLPSVESFSGISRWGLTLTNEGPATVLNAEVIDAGYFSVFRVQPVLGRPFSAAETDPAQSDVVLLSHGVWQSRFSGDPDVIGRRIQLDGYLHETREIIGVMPRGYRSLGEPAEVWIPLHVVPGRELFADSSWYMNQLVARMKPGATVGGVSAEVRTAVTRVRESLAPRVLFDDDAVRAATGVNLRDNMVGGVRRSLWLLLGAVGLVLLIACANLANLQLARAAARRRDLALRAALGATHSRLMREQLAESGLLAAVGGLVGVLLARGALSLLRVVEASGLPVIGDVSLDARVLLFAVASVVGSLLLFGVFPAWRAARSAPREDLHQGGRGALTGLRAHRVSRGLVAIETTLAMVLVTAAALMLSSFAALQRVDPGLDVADVLAVELVPSHKRYEGERAVVLYRELLDRIRALPGVTAAGAIQLTPFAEGNWGFPYLAEGHSPPPNGLLPSANFRIVTPGYFEAVDVPVLEGRGFTDADRVGGEQVIVINRTLASELWPGQDPLGRELKVFGSMPFRIVGVVGDVRQHTLDQAPKPEMYVPLADWSIAPMVLLIERPRATEIGPAVREIVRAMDPDIPIEDMRPLSDVLGDSLARRRFFALLLVGFGVLALVLGGVGVYGVMSHLVGTALPEFGVRLALGASPRTVLHQTMWKGVAPAALGLIVGLVGSLGAARLLRGLLYSVSPVHVPTYAIVAVALLAVALFATWLPARRAARLDPLAVLRAD